MFQDLAIEQVELSSEPIDLDVGALLKGQPLQLRQSFAVKGWVQFSETGLTRCLQVSPNALAPVPPTWLTSALNSAKSPCCV